MNWIGHRFIVPFECARSRPSFRDSILSAGYTAMPMVNWRKLKFALAILCLIGTPTTTALSATQERTTEIAKRSANVMPFNLKQTQHIFSKTESGGIQQVIARNPADSPQIALIRQHLKKISQEFSHGDFSDPALIHGEDMPGLAVLREAKPGQFHVEYKDLKDGGEITYSSQDRKVIDGIHQWFDAQLSDHGPDATAGHHHGTMHHSP